MTEPGKNKKGQAYRRTMTVGYIREPDPSGCVEVVFLESARFYRLLGDNPKFNDILKQLRDAEREKRTVNTTTTSVVSDIIEDVA